MLIPTAIRNWNPFTLKQAKTVWVYGCVHVSIASSVWEMFAYFKFIKSRKMLVETSQSSYHHPTPPYRPNYIAYLCLIWALKNIQPIAVNNGLLMTWAEVENVIVFTLYGVLVRMMNRDEKP